MIREDEPWQVDLPAGTYTVQLDSHFEGRDGIAGGVYVGFGLVVDAAHERTVSDVEDGDLNGDCENENEEDAGSDAG